MSYRAIRVTVRFGALEHARLLQTLGFNGALDPSRAIRQAVQLWCEHVETQRARREAELAEKGYSHSAYSDSPGAVRRKKSNLTEI
jgi:hypothetical protein